MFTGPMTAIVAVLILVCLGVGLIIVLGAVFAKPRKQREKVCRQCRTRNPRHAKFCAHCGRRLGG